MLVVILDVHLLGYILGRFSQTHVVTLLGPIAVLLRRPLASQPDEKQKGFSARRH
jgi:hypothetical protein